MAGREVTGGRWAAGLVAAAGAAAAARVLIRRRRFAMRDDPPAASRDDEGRFAEPELDPEQLKRYAADIRKSYAVGLRRSKELSESYLSTVLALAAAIEAKDDTTGNHIQRVHRLGLMLLEAVEAGAEGDAQAGYGFLLHDIGKLSVPDAVLNKRGPLDETEWELMREHPEAGRRILAHVPFLTRALEIVLHHHERWDGSGYPEGLAGEQIPIAARVFSVVDAVDAMTSDRPYRPGMPFDEALRRLRAGAGTQFDPRCVEAFCSLDRERVEQLLEGHAEAV